MPGRSMWTGYYSEWDKMSDNNKQIVMDTRKKKKSKGLTPKKRKVSTFMHSLQSSKALDRCDAE